MIVIIFCTDLLMSSPISPVMREVGNRQSVHLDMAAGEVSYLAGKTVQDEVYDSKLQFCLEQENKAIDPAGNTGLQQKPSGSSQEYEDAEGPED